MSQDWTRRKQPSREDIQKDLQKKKTKGSVSTKGRTFVAKIRAEERELRKEETHRAPENYVGRREIKDEQGERTQ